MEHIDLAKSLGRKCAEVHAEDMESSKNEGNEFARAAHTFGFQEGVLFALRALTSEVGGIHEQLFEMAKVERRREFDAEAGKEWPTIISTDITLPEVGSPCTGTIGADYYGGTVVNTWPGKRPEIHVRMDNGGMSTVRMNKQCSNGRCRHSQPRWNDGCLVFNFGRAVNKLDPHF
jgi:hypothetical protein